MADKSLRDELAILMARLLGMRDVVARLLAYQAQSWENPEDLLRDFSQTTENKLGRVVKKVRHPSLEIEEAIQKEVDWIVGQARAYLGEDEE